MKKIYEKPLTEVMNIKIESCLLAGTGIVFGGTTDGTEENPSEADAPIRRVIFEDE